VIRYRALVLLLRAVQALDRLRLRVRCALQPGLELHPDASSNLAVARYQLEAGARLRIGAGVVTERLPGRLHFSLGPGALVEIGDGAWLRTEVGEIHLVAFEGARLRVGPECLLNGCHLSAKQEVTLGRKTNVGMGSRVFDSDQHDFDDERMERSAPVTMGDHVWVASDVTVLRGVSIGDHSIVGACSLVTRDIPPHSVAFGQPAEPRGKVGDRSNTR
jgi:carbonic anhydrase/acetyltransferase-like protein (isoleucine patch superfamily)